MIHMMMSSLTIQGVDDERSGELPRAFVVKSSDDLTEQQAKDYVKGQVAEYQQLKGGVNFIREIPKSPNGRLSLISSKLPENIFALVLP